MLTIFCLGASGCLAVSGGYTTGSAYGKTLQGGSIDITAGWIGPSSKLGAGVATRVKLLDEDFYQVAITPAAIARLPLVEGKLFLYGLAGMNVAQFEADSYGMFGPVGGAGLLWSRDVLLIHLGATAEYDVRFEGANGGFATIHAGISLPIFLLFANLGRIH